MSIFILGKICPRLILSSSQVTSVRERNPPHMWLMGCPNPCKLEQKLECTFLKPFIQVKTKWASKKFSIYAIQSYQLHSKADSAHQGWIGLTAWLVTLNGIGEKFFWCSSWFYMGKRFQKNALPFLFQFARVRAAHQLLVAILFLNSLWNEFAPET